MNLITGDSLFWGERSLMKLEAERDRLLARAADADQAAEIEARYNRLIEKRRADLDRQRAAFQAQQARQPRRSFQR